MDRLEEQGSHGGNPNRRGCFSIPPYLLGNYQILLAGLSKLPFPKQDKSLPSGSSHSRERERQIINTRAIVRIQLVKNVLCRKQSFVLGP